MTIKTDRRPNIYYFGCDGGPGHYMHTPDMRTDWKFMRDNPWGLSIDGGLLPKQEHLYQPVIAHKNGWTAVAFWDRTVDTRPGSNSCFLAEGEYSIKEMMRLAMEHFPGVMRRLPRSLKELAALEEPDAD